MYYNVQNFTERELMLAVQNQRLRKACGPNGLYMESYIYGSPKLLVHITMMFILFLKHGYIPKSFIRSIIVPLVKKKWIFKEHE